MPVTSRRSCVERFQITSWSPRIAVGTGVPKAKLRKPGCLNTYPSPHQPKTPPQTTALDPNPNIQSAPTPQPPPTANHAAPAIPRGRPHVRPEWGNKGGPQVSPPGRPQGATRTDKKTRPHGRQCGCSDPDADVATVFLENKCGFSQKSLAEQFVTQHFSLDCSSAKTLLNARSDPPLQVSQHPLSAISSV